MGLGSVGLVYQSPSTLRMNTYLRILLLVSLFHLLKAHIDWELRAKPGLFNQLDYCMGLIILGNIAIMILELDSIAAGNDQTEFQWTDVIGWVVLAIFILELLFRMFVFQQFFFKDPWNVFDFVIVLSDVIFSVIGLVVGDAFPISILRVFRLSKLARISKVLRVFPELRVLMAGLAGSARAIFWGMVLLCFVLLVWSMLAVTFLHPLARDMEFDGCQRCSSAYSTVMRSSLTMWKEVVAGDSWGLATVPLIEKHPVSLLFFIPQFLSVSMAVMNLILGVVVQVALSAKDQIEVEDCTYKKLFKMEKQTHLLNLCHQMDEERSGCLSREVVFKKFEEPGDFRDSILAMDVTEEDFYIIWMVVDAERSGSVPYKDLVNRLYAIRSSDTDFMLAYIKYYVTQIQLDLKQTLERQHAETKAVQSRIEKEIEEVEEQEELILDEIQHTEELVINAECWQELDETQILKVQEKNGLEVGSTANIKGSTSAAAMDSSHERLKDRTIVQASRQHSHRVASTNLDGATGAWGKEIETLRAQLKKTLSNMNQELESKVVSLIRQMSTQAQTGDKQGLQAKSDFHDSAKRYSTI